MYVEHFDMDKNGNPINAHPLTVKEANVLAKALTPKRKDKAFKTKRNFADKHFAS
jgi:hypothetical protein